MKDYTERIILPCIERKRQDLKLVDHQPALLLFDNFKAQCTQELLTMLDNNFTDVV